MHIYYDIYNMVRFYLAGFYRTFTYDLLIILGNALYLHDASITRLYFTLSNISTTAGNSNFFTSTKYEGGWKAENLHQLKRRISYCVRKIDLSLVQRLAGSSKSRLDHIRRHDIIENQ